MFACSSQGRRAGRQKVQERKRRQAMGVSNQFYEERGNSSNLDGPDRRADAGVGPKIDNLNWKLVHSHRRGFGAS